MAHQFQGMVLVDGEWVSRPGDVFQAMARAQQQPHTEMKQPETRPQHEVPHLGIVSRTVFASPVVKFILPANIRQKKLNDVVFIGEDSVHLKEIRAYGHLRHIASKSDFRGRILAASIFGEPRRHEVPATDGTPLKRAVLSSERREDVQSVEAKDILPPQVIVLTLTSRTLMFLWAQSTHTGTVRFCQKTVRLPAGTMRYDRPGTFLAVDPKCRAIAVAAPEGQCLIYMTKMMDNWRDDIEAGRDVVPIEHEQLIPVQGRIMHMEFLSPGLLDQDERDEFHVVLLFIVAHGGKTKITCFDWDSRYPLSRVTARAERVAVDPDDHNPALLVPLNESPDFLLICGRHISKYKNILSGHPTPLRSSIPDHILQYEQPADSKGPPLWVQWERVPRHGSSEAFYIAREDGVVIYLEVGNGSEMVIYEAGKWAHPIDRAFASLDVEHGSGRALLNPDVLVAAGTTSDGHVYKVGAWMEEYSMGKSFLANNTFAFVESIPNWAPIADLCVTRLPGARTVGQRDSIFVANGRTPHGTISELRRGLNALVDGYSEGMTGCTGLWVMDYGTEIIGEEKQHYAVLLVSLPPESFVVRLFHTEAEGGAWDDGEWSIAHIPDDTQPAQDGVCRDEETLAACWVSPSLSVQITRNSARLLRRHDLGLLDSLTLPFPTQQSVPFPAPALAAAVNSNLDIIAYAFRNGQRTVLQVIKISSDGTFDSNPATQDLPSDPTCLEFLSIGGGPYILAGTWENSIWILKHDESSVTRVFDCALGSASNGPRLCETAVVLTSGSHQILLCGLRNGHLLIFDIDVSGPDGFTLVPKHEVIMGPTAARVTRSATDSSAAFVACGSDFCRVRCTRNLGSTSSVDIDSVWFTDHQTPEYQQSPVTALDQLPLTKGDQVGKDLSGFIFAVSGSRLLFSRLDYDIRWSRHEAALSTFEPNKAVPRRLETTASPTKLVYLEKLRKMVVATTETREERAPPDGYRSIRSAIRLVNMEDDETRIEIKQEEDIEVEVRKSKLIVGEFWLKNYERVYAILDWTYVDEKGKKYHFVIVGTGITQRNGKETGRKLFLQVADTNIKLKKESTFDHPVRCMALYGPNELVTVIDRSLTFELYQPLEPRWIKQGQLQLPSAAVHVTTVAPYIYVSTASDSHICYLVRVHPLESRKVEFDKVFTDGRQRLCAHHLALQFYTPQPLPEPLAPSSILGPPSQPASRLDTLVLVADKVCSLVGLFQPPARPYQSAAPMVFEANLPRSITRLQRGDVRPPWRRPVRYVSSPPGVSSPTIRGVLADDIIGTCSDGTVYTLSIVSAPALKLLKFIQNLVEVKEKRNLENQHSIVRNDDDDVFMNGAEDEKQEPIKAREVDPEHQNKGQARARAWYVDGDVIMRFLEEKGLNGLLTDGTDTEAIERLFWNLVETLNLEKTEHEVLPDSDLDLVEHVETWVWELLMPVL
ncbi:uncharacterized protein BDR25DRAFT_317100 [Lindgomyces ingoldianus]|uniref:Uncharacterized protein n=1 Tax=Lindgomyces ingoldianus TaxID=673940 RepID=A0ACB6QK96_9PLEO|nr:uncharacterized protein BDR25DRAFT_317100 [Lindgomyces ingoldianus]KAF2467358.1 hypothetical protein BDR25DRAFT_317100 [Lindgomyces ingoldianus]